MSEQPKALYAASCNPPRRAKRSGSDSTPVQEPRITSSPGSPTKQASVPRPILPRRPIHSVKANSKMDLPTQHDADSQPPAPAPPKRGRKPGPLSRTAREAQRRLNHSIIEKARRTKINEALATLKQLVPPDYGQKQAPAEDSNVSDDDDDDDYDDGSKKKKSTKPGGKREEKEKEFKLEILIRTVSFMQDLLERVSVLEQAAQGCSSCGGNIAKKRKRSQTDEWSEKDTRGAPHPRRMSDGDSSKTKPPLFLASKPQAIEEQQAVASLPTPPESRLPPISSWLPNSVIDPSLLSPTGGQPQSSLPSNSTSHLPSPPSSTRFNPVRSNNVPPSLSLGPVATASILSPTRTPEDESAASLLLQISASSPPFRPVSSYPLSDPSKLVLPSGKSYTSMDAQTPSSLLGLNHPTK